LEKIERGDPALSEYPSKRPMHPSSPSNKMSVARTHHAEAIAAADEKLERLIKEARGRHAEEVMAANMWLEATLKLEMEADALAYRKLLAEGKIPTPSSYADRPKTKKRPEGMSDEDWAKDCARRERNARNSARCEERKKALGLKSKPRTPEEEEQWKAMTDAERHAVTIAKRKETTRLRLEREALSELFGSSSGSD